MAKQLPQITVDSTGVGLGSQTYSVIATDENGCTVEDESLLLLMYAVD